LLEERNPVKRKKAHPRIEEAKIEKKTVKTKNPLPSNVRRSIKLNKKPSQQSTYVVSLEEEEKMEAPSPTVILLVHSPG